MIFSIGVFVYNYDWEREYIQGEYKDNDFLISEELKNYIEVIR